MFSLDLEACGALSEGFCFALLPRIWRTFAKRSGEHEFGQNDYPGESNTGVEYLPVLAHSHDLAKFDGTLISNSDYFIYYICLSKWIFQDLVLLHLFCGIAVAVCQSKCSSDVAGRSIPDPSPEVSASCFAICRATAGQSMQELAGKVHHYLARNCQFLASTMNPPSCAVMIMQCVDWSHCQTQQLPESLQVTGDYHAITINHRLFDSWQAARTGFGRFSTYHRSCVCFRFWKYRCVFGYPQKRQTRIPLSLSG